MTVQTSGSISGDLCCILALAASCLHLGLLHLIQCLLAVLSGPVTTSGLPLSLSRSACAAHSNIDLGLF